jgi:PAS domain S-box-containing protein
MKKRKAELEKRIFILFFIITFLLVLTIIFIEWQLVKFGITQYEDVNLNLTFSAFKIVQSEKQAISQNKLIKFTSDIRLEDAIRIKNAKQISNRLHSHYEQADVNILTIYSRERMVLFGTKWDLIDKYLAQIYQNASKEESGSFIANFGNKLFQIDYYPLISSKEIIELLAVFIIVERIEISTFHLKSQYNLKLVPFDGELNEVQIQLALINHIEDLNLIVQNMSQTQEIESIHRLNVEHAVGIHILYDLHNQPGGILLVSYFRDTNRFANQSLLLFVLILLATTLIMIVLLGNWFSKTILMPVNSISERMREISVNPSTIKPIEQKYTGVLGDMVASFNTMNIALSNHRKNMQEYKIITDNIDSGIFWLDNDFNIILFNPSFMKITGLKKEEEIIGKNLSRLLGTKKNILNIMEGYSITLPQLEIYPNNRLKYVTLNLRRTKYDEGYRFFGSITDISNEIKQTKAREALELELIKSNKAAELGRKVEGIVHNINSPLNSILGYAQLLKKEHKDNEDIAKIIDAGKKIARNVKGLLTKVKQSNISSVRPIKINELIDQELDFCEHNLFFKHYVTLEKNFQEDIPKFNATYSDISLCIANIINNAIEALKNSEDKILQVRTYSHNNMIAIEIEDSGEGIKEKDIPKIFESYFSTKTGKDGTGFGLGLAISKSVVEKYNGYITVDSKVKLGSKFTINLPIK